MNKLLLGLTLLAPTAFAWSPATYSVKSDNELSFRLMGDGTISNAHSNLHSRALMSKRTSVGKYDVNVKNFIKGVAYNKVSLTCSINNEAPKKRVACYKVKGKPHIRVLVTNVNGNPVDGITGVSLKW